MKCTNNNKDIHLYSYAVKSAYLPHSVMGFMRFNEPWPASIDEPQIPQKKVTIHYFLDVSKKF